MATAAPETSPRPNAAERAVAAVALLVILAVAAFLRLRGLGDASVWRDEAVSWTQAHGSLADIVAATARDNYPPLHNFFLAAAMHVFGDAEWALRLPSAVFGILNVLALYWIGRMVAGRGAGLLAALLLALSAFHVWYSQEARMYALLALVATLYGGAALAFLRRPGWPWAIAVVLAGTATLYSHPYGAFVCLSVAIAGFVLLVVRRGGAVREAAAWLLLHALSAIAFLPWAVVLAERAGTIERVGFWIPRPSVPFVTDQLTQVVSGPLPLLLLAGAAVAAFVVPSAAPASARPETPALRLAVSSDLWLILAWLAGPIAIGLVISIVGAPVFFARYVIGSLPPFILLAAIGLDRFVTGRWSAAVVAIFALAAAGVGLAYGVPSPHENWRDATALVEAQLPAGGCILVPDYLSLDALTYYDRDPAACVIDVSQRKLASIAASDVIAIAVGNQRDRVANLPPPWMKDSSTPFYGIDVMSFHRPAP